VTAAHRGPVKRPRTEVSRRKPDVVGLPVQDLVDEVVDDEPVVTGEAGDERAGVVAVLERQGGELQGRDPPFGPALEGVDVRAVRSRPMVPLR
jgi:hypothetical protein